MIGGPRRYAKVVAVAGHAPSRVLTNAELEGIVATDDEWIRERRIAAADEATSDLVAAAGRLLLQRANIAPADVDGLLVGTCTPDHLFPSTASIVCRELGINAGSFDLLNACSSFVYGLAQGCGMIESGIAKTVMVMGGETLSRITDWSDRSTAILFGDGAGGALLVGTESPDDASFLAFDLGTNPDIESLSLGAGGSRLPANRGHAKGPEGFISMNGREVFKWASRIVVESVDRLLERSGLTAADIDCFVPHQANLRIIEHAVARTGIPMERVMVNIDRYGNTSAGSVPLALAEAYETGRIRPGSVVCTIGFGAGLAWAGSIFRYWGPAA
jgi:3-oxoacyl-[acyl-carrier-protein] synthase III